MAPRLFAVLVAVMLAATQMLPLLEPVVAAPAAISAPAPPTPNPNPNPNLNSDHRLGDDLNTLKTRLVEFYLDAGVCFQTQFCNDGGYNLPQQGGIGCVATCTDSQRVLGLLAANGSWPDVDYTDRTASLWKTAGHMERVLSMLRSYHCGACTSLHGSSALLAGAHRALDYWLQQDFESGNWWWNDIGIPELVAGSLLLVDAAPGGMSTAELAGGVTIMNRAQNGSGVGENLLWTQQVAIMRSVLENKPTLVASIAAAMWAAVQVGTGDGIQRDWSFHFHGPLVAVGTYGADYALNLAAFGALTRGTSFAPSGTALNITAAYILDGQRWAMRTAAPAAGAAATTRYDANVKGREISRPPDGNLVVPAIWANFSLSLGNLTRPADFAAFHAMLEGSSPLVGTKHFWRTDYTAHHRPGFLQSLRMYSKRTLNDETTNSECLTCFHTADGMLLTLPTGGEYSGIFPTWNWTALPGTTERHDVDELSSKLHQMGPTAFVGGCSDGHRAVSVMDFQSGVFADAEAKPITARKTWFFLDEGVLALANSISLDAPAAVSTALEQSLQIGEVLTSTRSSPVPDGQTNLGPGVAWVAHNNIAYTQPPQSRRFHISADGATRTTTATSAAAAAAAAAASWVVTAGGRTGTWQKLNSGASNSTVSNRVFQLDMVHGPAPRNASYVYAVLPGVGNKTDSVAAAVGAFWHDRVHGVLNTPSAAALVYTPAPAGATGGADTVYMASIWTSNATVIFPDTRAAATTTKAAGAAVGDALAVTASQPAALMFTHTADGHWLYAASLPAATSGLLQLNVPSGSPLCNGHSLSLQMPSDDSAGATVLGQCPD